MFDYGIANGQQIANYRDKDGNVVAQKLRSARKEFTARGDFGKALLFGQHLWRDGGKMIVITEGEIDAMSVAEIQDRKWPVVSVPNGAQSAPKALAKQLEWLEKFETVVLMFDNDAPGKKAAAECAELFTPGKCKIATLPLKDANDMLKAGRGSEVINAMWGAKAYRPDGIVNGAETWDRLQTRKKVESKPYPWDGLNLLVEGFRRGELTMMTSGSGMGKTEVAGQVMYDLACNSDETVGLLHLEENIERSCDRWLGLHLKKRIHLESVRSTIAPADVRAAWEATLGTGRVFLYDHFGSTADDNLIAKIRYLAKGCGCTTILLDHISIVVSGMEDGDERRTIDNLMTKLATLAQELNIRLLVISHLKRPDGTPHEEGGRVTAGQLRGSHSLLQLSFTVIALERNQQDPERKLWTRVRVLKCRHTGNTGHACWLKYNTETGWLEESTPPFEDEETKTPFQDETQTKEQATF
jgi:twinkle protein